MPRGGARFTNEELRKVLGFYDIGKVHQLEPLTAGSRSAPKVIVIADDGKFLLKRRPKGKDDMYRVAFAHSVQIHLSNKNFPVSRLVATAEDNLTVLQLDNHIYELFTYIEGIRYDGTPEATRDCGRQMANFHVMLSDFNHEALNPLGGAFHDSGGVRSHLKTIGSKKKAPLEPLKYTADNLMRLYEKASVQVNALGYDSWKPTIVHGDWHPGNMLFADRQIAAVIDFDSIKVAPPITDLANGMLQFSIVGGRPNPADWPDYLNQDRLVQFVDGYRDVKAISVQKQAALIDLMVETMIAEAVLPVATTGFFGNLKGDDFLNMIGRKAKWINRNRNTLIEAISH